MHHPRLTRTHAVAAASALVLALSACSSTNQAGADETSAEPSATSASASGDGPITVQVPVNAYATSADAAAPDPAETDEAKALQNVVDQMNADLPEGGREITLSFVSTDAVYQSVYGDEPGCDALFADGVPDVLLPFSTQFDESQLSCYNDAGTIVLVGQPVIEATSYLESAPNVFLARGATLTEWSNAVSQALTDTLPEGDTDVVIMGPESTQVMSDDMLLDGYTEILSALTLAGFNATLFQSPTYDINDLASAQAAFAVVPTKLRALDMDALVLPGLGTEPLPIPDMADQSLTPVVFAAPNAVLSSWGDMGLTYPADLLHELPAPSIFGDEAAGTEMRVAMAETEWGQACLAGIDVDGTQAELASVEGLGMRCDALYLLEAAASASADALSSADAFGAALASLGEVTLVDGTIADFSDEDQTAATEVTMSVGDTDCGCTVPEATYSLSS